LADHGRVTPAHLAELDGLNLRRRNIDHDIAVAEEAGHGLHPDQVGLELRQAYLGGYVEGDEGAAADGSVWDQAVADLETAYRCIDIGIEGVRETGRS